MTPFDDLMSELDTAMMVVTTVAGDECAGCLVGFHSQCSIDPSRYAIWLSKANRTYRVGLMAEYFGLHFLAWGDHDLAELFGAVTGDDEDKFARCAWRAGPAGLPLLDRCAARIVGRRVAVNDDGGDHVCFVLDAEDAQRPAAFTPLTLFAARDIEAGHEPEDRARPSP